MLDALEGVSLRAIADARRLAHHLVQPLAAIGTALVPPEPDDGHTTLQWQGAFATWGTSLGTFGLDLETLDIVHNEERFSAVGMTLDEFWGVYQAHVKDVQLIPRNYGEPLPAHPVMDGATIPEPGDGLRALAAIYAFAFHALGALEIAEPHSRVRCWPHHFDVATLIALDDDAHQEHARSINVGMSPGDGSIARPYFYVTPWPPPDKSLPALDGGGRWHREGFTAAVLELSPATDRVRPFLNGALSAALSLME